MRTSPRALALIGVLLLVPASLVACSDDDSGSAATTSTSTTASTSTSGGEDGRVITAPGPIELAVGERATIELVGNATTGYSWTVDQQPDAAVVTVESDRYVGPGDGAAVGQGGHQQVVIQGVAPGTTTLGMAYARPWEEGTPPAQTASFAITVR
jgi:predicted secreted protein